jgi:hypothetical protein
MIGGRIKNAGLALNFWYRGGFRFSGFYEGAKVDE